MKGPGLLALFLVLVIAPAPALARAKHRRSAYQFYGSASGSPWTKKPGWTNQAAGKLAYGLRNTLLGWTELFTEPFEAPGQGRSLASGIGEGLWNAVNDTVGGVLQTVTFPLTSLDITLPEGGARLP